MSRVKNKNAVVRKKIDSTIDQQGLSKQHLERSKSPVLYKTSPTGFVKKNKNAVVRKKSTKHTLTSRAEHVIGDSKMNDALLHDITKERFEKGKVELHDPSLDAAGAEDAIGDNKTHAAFSVDMKTEILKKAKAGAEPLDHFLHTASAEHVHSDRETPLALPIDMKTEKLRIGKEDLRDALLYAERESKAQGVKAVEMGGQFYVDDTRKELKQHFYYSNKLFA